MYLGTKLKHMQLQNGIWTWSMSPSKYVQETVESVKGMSKGYKLFRRANNPFESGYCPKMEAPYYQSVIIVMRWMIEIGHTGINTEVSLLSLHSVMLRQGHLEAVLHVIVYLKLRHNSRLAFDPSCPHIDQSNFWESFWRDFYKGSVEVIPSTAPPPRGKEADLHMFVDSDHAANKWIRRSRTGFMIYMDMSKINWYYKKQSTIETSFWCRVRCHESGCKNLACHLI